jgi:hypothetical protein
MPTDNVPIGVPDTPTDAVQEFAIPILVKQTTFNNERNDPTISFQTANNEEYSESTDSFIQEAELKELEGYNSLVYTRENGSQLILTDTQQMANLMDSVIMYEERSSVDISRTEIAARNLKIQIEDLNASKQDLSDQNIETIELDQGRVLIGPGKLNLNAGTLARSLEESKIVGDKFRFPYTSSKGTKSVFYLSLQQAEMFSQAVRGLLPPNIRDQIYVKNNPSYDVPFENPTFDMRRKMISSGKYELPEQTFEYPTFREFIPNGDDYKVNLYFKSDQRIYRFGFDLDTYNRLLRETS